MAGTMTTEEFQKQTLEFLRAQQDAYLETIKAWRDAMTGGMQPPQPPEWPKPPEWPNPPDFGKLPGPDEVAEASYAFAAKLLAEQSRFMAELGKAMAGAKGKS